MSYGGKEIAEGFRTVRKNTLQIAEDIPEDQYGFVAAAGVMSVSQMLTHIALSPQFQYSIHAEQRATTLEGFDFPGLIARITAAGQKAVTKADIIGLLNSEADRFTTWADGLTDDFLAERVGAPGGQPGKTRLEMLLGVKEHEMHHRGQLMLVERLLGIVPHLTRQRMQQQAART